MGRRRKRERRERRRLLQREPERKRIQASEVDTPKEFEAWLDEGYDVATAEVYRLDLVEYDDEQRIVTSKPRVNAVIAELRATMGVFRERGERYVYGEYAQERGISEAQAKREIDAEYKAKARATLTAARASKVRLAHSQKQFLQQLERGDFTETTFSKEQYQVGTFDFQRVQARRAFRGGAGSSATTASARREKRRDFLINIGAIDERYTPAPRQIDITPVRQVSAAIPF